MRNALPTEGDKRFVIFGTEAISSCANLSMWRGRERTNHTLLVNGEIYEFIDASNEPPGYFQAPASDIVIRTQSAMKQTHCNKVIELALKAQNMATRPGEFSTLTWSLPTNPCTRQSWLPRFTIRRVLPLLSACH